jgi:hypothetical protein
VRNLCSRLLAVVAFALLPICLGGLSGCGPSTADGSLAESPEISADQQSEVKARYQKQISDRQSKSPKKGKSVRRKPPK